jgi:hypothetical protein
MTKKKKVPATALLRGTNKEVRTPLISSDVFPSWRFSTVDHSGPYVWPKGTEIEQQIVNRLHDFDSMTWAQIEGPDHHFLTQGSLSNDAKKRLEEIGRDDEIDLLFSFHLQGEPRIICIRERSVAKLLWYDPKHGVCPVTKK